ncbi:MAG: UDP-N-acetylmuramoyl-tripeptide--D-alanyl-D-alanine ligase, partial [Actinomycetota bacterium]|nr:UDP-N-acetylmuramoyl-tripeptide--D-alanyl-D-alanine ligase [Actinomycetota bacterium]
SRAEHEAIGRYCVRLNVDHLIVVGDDAEPIARGACLEGFDRKDVWQVRNGAGALEILRAEVAPGDAVLVKSSRVGGLQAVATGLVDILAHSHAHIPVGGPGDVETTGRGTEEPR